jgi:HEAT repeat protein
LTEIVAKKLDHHDQFVRSAAALAITRIDSDLGTLRKEIRKLIKQSQSEQLGINMAMELGDESIEFLDDLIPLTSNEDPIVRESVAIALGQMGPAAKSALSRLEPLSRDEDALVRHAATKAIAKIKSGK